MVKKIRTKFCSLALGKSSVKNQVNFYASPTAAYGQANSSSDKRLLQPSLNRAAVEKTQSCKEGFHKVRPERASSLPEGIREDCQVGSTCKARGREQPRETVEDLNK